MGIGHVSRYSRLLLDIVRKPLVSHTVACHHAVRPSSGADSVPDVARGRGRHRRRLRQRQRRPYGRLVRPHLGPTPAASGHTVPDVRTAGAVRAGPDGPPDRR